MKINMTRTNILLFGMFAFFVVTTAVFPQSRMAGEIGKRTAIIRGTVRSDTGSLLYGILVKTRGEGMNYTTAVFTDEHGRYEFPPLPLASYKLSVGTRWQGTVELGAPGVSKDFTVELGSGFMNQTTGASWGRLIPGTEAEKTSLQVNCAYCHSYWRLFDGPQTTVEGWAALGRKMARLSSTGAPLLPDQPDRVDLSEPNFSALTQYLTRVVTPDLKERKVEEAMVRPRDEAARAVFTEWDLSKEVKQTGIPWTDPQGVIWFTTISHDGFDGMGKLDPRTGEVKNWPSSIRNGSFHDVLGDAEGSLWITASAAKKIVKFDTKTYQYTIWDVPSKSSRWPHTGDFDPEGNFWFTLEVGEGAVAKLDPRTGVVTEYPVPTKKPEPYGLEIDKQGNIWFTELLGHKVAKIDRRTGKITEYEPPTPKAGPRRIQRDSKGRLWFTEFFADKIGMLDPTTMKFVEYDIGVPGGSPYFLKIDKHDKIWFNLLNGNIIGKFDPDTKKFTLCLFPEAESHSRDAAIDNSTDPVAVVYGRAFLAQNNYKAVIGRMYVRR